MSASSLAPSRTGIGILTLLAVAGLALAGCTAESKSSSAAAGLASTPAEMSSAAPAASAAAGATVEGAANGHAGSNAAAPAAGPAAGPSAGPSAPSPLLAHKSIIYTGDITLIVDDVNAVMQQVIAEANTVGGYVDSEQASLQPKDANGNGAGQASATITLKVPPDSITRVMNDLAKLGTETSQNLHQDDVTAQVADVGARITAAQASLTRLEDLFQHAGTVAQLADVESQIAQREADLESLEAQQRALSAQVRDASITVNLHATSAPPPAVPKPKKAHVIGFLRGLHGGWHAFTAVVSGLATAIGALLPFFGVLLALGGAAFVGWRRTNRHRHGPTGREAGVASES